jgi:DNA gyrase/topoisomerase IV subunit A
MAIRFNENEVRSMGLVAAGVNAIKLKPGDYVVGAAAVEDKDEVALVTQRGLAKRTPGSDFPVQGRYGQGVTRGSLTKATRSAVGCVGKLTGRGVSHFKIAQQGFSPSQCFESEARLYWSAGVYIKSKR